jgi:hypothetical protein
MDPDSLSKLCGNLERGVVQPHRVLVDSTGRSTTPELALSDYGIVAVLGFVRKDGWTLGAPPHLADVAAAMWAEHWFGQNLRLPVSRYYVSVN